MNTISGWKRSISLIQEEKKKKAQDMNNEFSLGEQLVQKNNFEKQMESRNHLLYDKAKQFQDFMVKNGNNPNSLDPRLFNVNIK